MTNVVFSIDRAALANKYFDGGRACCLGQYAKAFGHPGHLMGDVAQRHMRDLLQPIVEAKAFSIILINNADLFCGGGNLERAGSLYEQRVISAFALAGVTATFTGEYPT